MREDYLEQLDKMFPLEFFRIWHAYHAKYKIPYNHDEANDFFIKLTLIFKEEK